VISLGRKRIDPCKGCWGCTRGRPCPVSRHDDLEEIKAAMIDCDMLILACPVYTNQVTAQMKALFDRLFTWCHIFPLLGKPSLSACTTGNEGHDEVGRFLEKMLATWGTSSFGTIDSIGGFTPGFFPWRGKARDRHRKLARKVARKLASGEPMPITRMQRKMYRVMKRKMSGTHAINCFRNGAVEGQPKAHWLRALLMPVILKKIGLTDAQLDKWAGFLGFELAWWRGRGWLWTRSFRQLAALPAPDGFDARARLLGEGEVR
jgi:hypothetical protein